MSETIREVLYEDAKHGGDAIEPLFDWPECGHTITGLLGIELRCTRPRHHALDGQYEHGNDDGTEWWMTDA